MNGEAGEGLRGKRIKSTFGEGLSTGWMIPRRTTSKTF